MVVPKERSQSLFCAALLLAGLCFAEGYRRTIESSGQIGRLGNLSMSSQDRRAGSRKLNTSIDSRRAKPEKHRSQPADVQPSAKQEMPQPVDAQQVMASMSDRLNNFGVDVRESMRKVSEAMPRNPRLGAGLGESMRKVSEAMTPRLFRSAESPEGACIDFEKNSATVMHNSEARVYPLLRFTYNGLVNYAPALSKYDEQCAKAALEHPECALDIHVINKWPDGSMDQNIGGGNGKIVIFQGRVADHLKQGNIEFYTCHCIVNDPTAKTPVAALNGVKSTHQKRRLDDFGNKGTAMKWCTANRQWWVYPILE